MNVKDCMHMKDLIYIYLTDIQLFFVYASKTMQICMKIL